jgi:hypothetical protein
MREVGKSYREVQKAEIRASKERILSEDDIWDIKDSRLLPKKGLDLTSFSATFKNVLPKGEINLKDYIEKTLVHRRGKATFVELGGTASQLSAEFTPGFFVESAGVSLTDYRNDPYVREQDAERNHQVIEGDILTGKTQSEVRSCFGGKTDIVFERMQAGKNLLPNEPFYMAQQVDIWYQFTGTLLFAEAPDGLKNYVFDWKEKVVEEYPNVLDVQVDTQGRIRIRKLPGAPESLPLLSAKDVMRQELRRRER